MAGDIDRRFGEVEIRFDVGIIEFEGRTKRSRSVVRLSFREENLAPRAVCLGIRVVLGDEVDDGATCSSELAAFSGLEGVLCSAIKLHNFNNGCPSTVPVRAIRPIQEQDYGPDATGIPD